MGPASMQLAKPFNGPVVAADVSGMVEKQQLTYLVYKIYVPARLLTTPLNIETGLKIHTTFPGNAR